MLNEDELRDALLLVFANKQDLPVWHFWWHVMAILLLTSFRMP